MHSYKTSRICPREINVEVADGVIESVSFSGGCDGNLKALSKLVEGRTVDEIAPLLEHNDCKGRGTSCAAQMVAALREAQRAG